MKNREEFSFYPWAATLLALVALASFLRLLLFPAKYLTSKVDHEREKSQISLILIKGAQSLQTRWELGDMEGNFAKGKFNCPREIGYNPQTDDQYLRCNPNYFQCYFEGGAGITNPFLEIREEGQTYRIRPGQDFPSIGRFGPAKRFYTIATRSTAQDGWEVPAYGLMMNLKVEGFPHYELTVILEDTCHSTYLPQRLYAYGSPILTKDKDKDKEDWIWDNFHRNIFVDKFQVTFRDIIEWMEYGNGRPKIKIPDNAKDWSQPATRLTLREMERYCAFRGKQLMEAHIFDAASFLPSDLDNPRPPAITRGPFPWTRKGRNSFIPPSSSSKKLSIHDCRLIHSAECQDNFPRELYTSYDASWVEMNQILGGPLEAFRNPLFPKENLKGSSWYFPFNHPWHQLGLRASWDGLGNSRDNVDWEIHQEINRFLGPPDVESYQIGFRCMSFSEGETWENETNEHE